MDYAKSESGPSQSDFQCFLALLEKTKEIFDNKLQELTYNGPRVSPNIPLFLHKIA